MTNLDQTNLDTLLHECRQCGTCCKTYKKVLLKPDEVERMKKLGANVGVMIHLNDLILNKINELAENEHDKDKIYMIHPDDKGCIFLEKRNDKYFCKIYNYRPESCRGFRCNTADESVDNLFMQDSIYLLGQDKYGRELS